MAEAKERALKVRAFILHPDLDKVLMQEEGEKYILPGGKLKRGEDVFEGLERCLKKKFDEETLAFFKENTRRLYFTGYNDPVVRMFELTGNADTALDLFPDFIWKDTQKLPLDYEFDAAVIEADERWERKRYGPDRD